MIQNVELNAVEASFCDRLVSIALMTTERALREHSLPVTVERRHRCARAVVNAAMNLILKLREETEGINQESQDLWLGSVVQRVLMDVWGFAVKPEQIRVLN